MKNPQLLKDVLSYHIVKGNTTSRHFSNNLTLRSLHHDLPVFINFYTDGWASVSLFLLLVGLLELMKFHGSFCSSGTQRVEVKL